MEMSGLGGSRSSVIRCWWLLVSHARYLSPQSIRKMWLRPGLGVLCSCPVSSSRLLVSGVRRCVQVSGIRYPLSRTLVCKVLEICGLGPDLVGFRPLSVSVLPRQVKYKEPRLWPRLLFVLSFYYNGLVVIHWRLDVIGL